MKDYKTYLIIALLVFLPITSFADGKAKVIELNQVACQFVESEARNNNFITIKKADCVAINKQTAKERLAEAKTMKLVPGSYIFRVKNVNVPYQLGFYVRSAKLKDRFRLPKVSGGGLYMGVTKDYKIHLIPGEYIYSCPLNPTPDYPLIVE